MLSETGPTKSLYYIDSDYVTAKSKRLERVQYMFIVLMLFYFK